MIKHITLGTKEVFYYDYDGESLPLRPISSFELDDCFYKSLIGADDEIADLIVRLKLSLVKPKEKIDINNKKYAELKKYFDRLDYWVVYHGMKDFQEFDFQKLDKGIPNGIKIITEMKHVHQISSKILTYSYQPKEIIEEVIKDEDGKLLATIVFNLNVPLAEFSNLTKLQRDFLVLSKLESRKPPEHTVSKTGDTVNLRDMLKGMV